MGPGRSDAVSVTGTAGINVTGTVKDNGDGSYTFIVSQHPGSTAPPGVIVSQPGRPPVGIPLPAPQGSGDDDDDDKDDDDKD